MYLKAYLKHEPMVSLGWDLWGSCRVLRAFGCRSHHGCSLWLLSQQKLHNCARGCWHAGCCSCGALARSCLSAGHHRVCCKRGVAAWQSCPELRSCSLMAWGALLVSQRGWDHSRISACGDTNSQRGGDFKPSLAAFRAVLCTSLWLLLVSWGFLVSEITLRCCQMKPAVSMRVLQVMVASTAGPWPREYGYSSKDQVMLLFIWAVLFLHFSIQRLHLICFPFPTCSSSCRLSFVEFPFFCLSITSRYQSTWGWKLSSYSSLWKHFCGWNCYLQKVMKPLSRCNVPWLCLHTHALNPLFRHGNLSYFFYSLPCLCTSNLLGPLWPHSGFSSLPAIYLRCLLGLNLHSGQR